MSNVNETEKATEKDNLYAIFNFQPTHQAKNSYAEYSYPTTTSNAHNTYH